MKGYTNTSTGLPRERGGGPPEAPVCDGCGEIVSECECVEPVTLFGNLGIGAVFTYEGSEYMKVAVDVAREIKVVIPGPCKSCNLPYRQFSDSTEVQASE